jgi:hypothetical protein
MPPVMSSTCMSICQSPAYASDLQDAGYSLDSTFVTDGKTYGHSDIAAMFDNAYYRLRKGFADLVGATRRVVRRSHNQFRRATMKDVGGQLQLSWYTIAFALMLGALAGPFGFVVAVVTVLFEHFFERDLNGDQAIASMAAAV